MGGGGEPKKESSLLLAGKGGEGGAYGGMGAEKGGGGGGAPREPLAYGESGLGGSFWYDASAVQTWTEPCPCPCWRAWLHAHDHVPNHPWSWSGRARLGCS